MLKVSEVMYVFDPVHMIDHQDVGMHRATFTQSHFAQIV